MYHIRVDTSRESPLVEYFSSISKRILISAEGSENPHLHVILDSETPVQTIRNNIRKYGFKGNASYSVSLVRDEVKALAYVIKDGDIILCTFEDTIMELARQYDIKVKDSVKKKSQTLPAIEEYARKSVPDITKLGIQSWLRLAVLYYKEQGLLFREFQVISQVQTLFLKHSEDGVKVLTSRLEQKLI